MSCKRWYISNTNLELASEIAQSLKISFITAMILVNRGISTIDEARRFLHLDISNLWDPFLLTDMDKAINRLIYALSTNEKILVFGDYDVDGITGTGLLIRVLRKISPTVDYYIPDRSEGYGLNSEAIRRIADSNYSLIVTVDNGISCYQEVELANSLGIDVIITDHHEPPENIPPAIAIVNPKRKNSNYPCKYLSGVGVGFKLCHALALKLKQPGLLDFVFDQLDLVAFGTVADIVPILDENRIIVANGLKKLISTNNIGIRELIRISGLENVEINTGHLGFVLGPRVNAIGRLDNPMSGVELFITSEIDKARELAEVLDRANRKRQLIEENIFKRAVEIIEEEGLYRKKSIILASEDWHPGVIGIVASKLVEKYYRPVILIAFKDGIGKGSARGIKGLNLYDALSYCSKELLGFGGHEMAAGLSVDVHKFDIFKDKFLEYVENVLTPEDLYPLLNIDVEVELNDLNFSLLEEIEKLEPFGPGNPRPIFALKKVSWEGRAVGMNDEHLKISVYNEQKRVGGIGFGLAAKLPLLRKVREIDLAFSLNRNIWNNQESLQLNLIDMIPAQLKDYELDCQVKEKALKAKSGFENLNDEELFMYLKEYFDSGQKIYDEFINLLFAEQSFLALSVVDWEINPTILSYAAYIAIRKRKLSCIVYSSKSRLQANYELINSSLKSLGLKTLKITPLQLLAKEELADFLRNGPIDIILTTSEYLHQLEKLNVFNNTGLLVISDIHRYLTDFDNQFNIISSIKKSNPVVVLYTHLNDQNLIEEGNSLFLVDEMVRNVLSRNLSIIDGRNISDKEDYLCQLLKKREKSLIVVNTSDVAFKLSNKLKKLIPEFSHQIMCYHQNLKDDEGKRIRKLFYQGEVKTLIISGLFSKGLIPSDIRHVVHYELGFNLNGFRDISLLAGIDGKKSWVHLLYNKDDLNKNQSLLKKLFPDRDLLAKIYIILQKLSTSEGYISFDFKNLLQVIRKQIKQDLSSNVLLEALMVFYELELLAFEDFQKGQKYITKKRSKQIRLLPKPKQKLDLTSSIRYNECVAEIEEFDRLIKVVFDEPVEILLNYIMNPEIINCHNIKEV